jgi:hypothetical protein
MIAGVALCIPSSPGDARCRDGMGDAGIDPPAGDATGTVLGRSRRYDNAY